MRSLGLLVLGVLSLVFVGPAKALECSRDCATQCTDINDPDLLLPDLVSQPPTYVHNANSGTHRVILFSSSPSNVGDGPLIVHGKTVDGPDGPVTVAVQEIWKRDGTSCIRDAGVFEYHPEHHHFHIGDFASYQLRKDDPYTGEIVAESTKVTFCLLDIAPVRGYRTQRQVASDCLNQEGTQGISVGYADVYDWYLPGQSIDLDTDPENPVPGGNYYIVNIVNQDGLLWEKDNSLEANIGYTTVRATAPRAQRIIAVRQPHAPSSSVGSTGSSTTGSSTTGSSTTDTSTTDTATSDTSTTDTTPTLSTTRGPHAPHVPFLGPRPRLPHGPHAPHSPRAPIH
jgi:hypothetical protein